MQRPKQSKESSPDGISIDKTCHVSKGVLFAVFQALLTELIPVAFRENSRHSAARRGGGIYLLYKVIYYHTLLAFWLLHPRKKNLTQNISKSLTNQLMASYALIESHGNHIKQVLNRTGGLLSLIYTLAQRESKHPPPLPSPNPPKPLAEGKFFFEKNKLYPQVTKETVSLHLRQHCINGAAEQISNSIYIHGRYTHSTSREPLPTFYTYQTFPMSWIITHISFFLSKLILYAYIRSDSPCLPPSL